MSDHDLAAHLADQAGRALLALRASVGDGAYDPHELKAAGDARAQAVLADLLARHAPTDAVLSEEASDDLARLDADRVWIIDPLDGTKEYSQRTDDGQWRDDWAVHVALWTRSAGLTVGAVAIPGRGTIRHTGAALPLPPAPTATLRIAVSRSHPSPFVAAVLSELAAQPVPMGSAGVKTIAVVDGVADAYVHAGGQFQWDSAAPIAVARRAGLFTSRIDTTEIVYNGQDLSIPDLVVCHPAAKSRVQAAVAQALTLEGQHS